LSSLYIRLQETILKEAGKDIPIPIKKNQTKQQSKKLTQPLICEKLEQNILKDIIYPIIHCNYTKAAA